MLYIIAQPFINVIVAQPCYLRPIIKQDAFPKQDVHLFYLTWIHFYIHSMYENKLLQNTFTYTNCPGLSLAVSPVPVAVSLCPSSLERPVFAFLSSSPHLLSFHSLPLLVSLGFQYLISKC